MDIWVFHQIFYFSIGIIYLYYTYLYYTYYTYTILINTYAILIKYDIMGLVYVLINDKLVNSRHFLYYGYIIKLLININYCLY